MYPPNSPNFLNNLFIFQKIIINVIPHKTKSKMKINIEIKRVTKYKISISTANAKVKIIIKLSFFVGSSSSLKISLLRFIINTHYYFYLKYFFNLLFLIYSKVYIKYFKNLENQRFSGAKDSVEIEDFGP